MPLRISFLAAVFSALLPAAGFHVLNSDAGPWPSLLSTLGLAEQSAAAAGLLVARPGTPASSAWMARVEAGAMLALEGESPLAAGFGFHPAGGTVQLTSIEDVHRPRLPIVLEQPLEIARYAIPPAARVFAKDRWSGAPLIAGFRSGKGAVLWVVSSPGPQGYERFPYLLHALHDLGLDPPFRSGRLWAFFDYSYRTRVDLDYFAKRWRAAGIGALQVAAWHFYDADPARDAYLARLITACHRQGILVYAWIELPHVSEKFWNDHPEWREKTAVLQDAQLDWRKLMNLTNRDCFRAVSQGIQALIGRFDWDGVNLAELYFESLEGASNPARFTPLNDDVRAQFRAQSGWDPLEIYAARRGDAPSLRQFLDFRAGLAHRMQGEWLAEIEKCRRLHPDLDVILTHVDDRFDAGMKDAIGADAARVLPLLSERDFTFLIEDPATVWNLGPQRYPEIAKRYQPITPKPGKLAIDINIVDRYQDVYPTRQQTGAELFALVHLAAQAFPRVALYFENSILPPDLNLLPAAAANARYTEAAGNWIVESAQGTGLRWKGPALVDGRPWPAQDGETVWLPEGKHTVSAAKSAPGTRLLDLTGTLQSAAATGHGLEFRYASSARTLARLSAKPAALRIDGQSAEIHLEGSTLLLPKGEHAVVVVVQE